MTEAADYSAVETLRNGQRLEIRGLRPEDRDEFAMAASRLSAESLYRRFFSAKRHFSEQERSFFIDVDFVKHVALIAVLEEGSGKTEIVGGARYVVTTPGEAEVAFAVVDQYQGLGIGARLMRHLAVIAREAGLHEFTAEVLPHNKAMLKVFEKSALRAGMKQESGTVHVTLTLG